MKPLIFFSDLDGTLLNDEKIITPKTYHALKTWCSLGNRLVLCSGRALDSILHVFHTLELTFPNIYLVGCNGGEIYDCTTHSLLLRRTISYSCLMKIFEIAETFNIHIQTYNDTHIITKKSGEELHYYKKAIHTPAVITEDILSLLPKPPCKCLAIELHDLSLLEKLRLALLQELGTQLKVIYSNPNYLEIFPRESGKDSAVHWLCDYLDLPLQNSLAAGDEMNDISMIKAAGCGIAMCNGRKEVKEAADLVTALDNNQDGLAHILLSRL